METTDNTEHVSAASDEMPERQRSIVRTLKTRPVVITASIVLIAVALFFAKGLFVAALVDGKPVYRLSVIRELEKQGGKRALEALIQRKLIETELDRQKISVPEEEVDADIGEIETRLAGEGRTLEEALAEQSMTEQELRKQIALQKGLEKLLAEEVAVTDEEVSAYIKDTKAVVPKGTTQEAYAAQVRGQLEQEKFQQEAQAWVSGLLAGADVTYFAEYR